MKGKGLIHAGSTFAQGDHFEFSHPKSVQVDSWMLMHIGIEHFHKKHVELNKPVGRAHFGAIESHGCK